jgi:glucose/arabinose dehydrogenase
MYPSSSTPVRLLPGPWALQHFPDSQPMMLEQLAMQRSLMSSSFVLADVDDTLDWFDDLRGVTRLVGVAGAHQALVGAHDRLRAARSRLREAGNVLTVFALTAGTDLQLNDEQKAMVTDLWKDGHHFGETLLFYPNTTESIDIGAFGVPPLVN